MKSNFYRQLRDMFWIFQIQYDLDYEHNVAACVAGNNIVSYPDKSVAECKTLCSQYPTCLAFEYGVDHGGSDQTIQSKDCRLQKSSKQNGCDGIRHNSDLYVKTQTGSKFCLFP